jgi:hypothetical protein
MEKNSAADTTDCGGSAAACALTTTCCKAKTGLCNSHACAANFFPLPSKLYTTGATDALCCQEKVKCTAVTCSAAKGLKAASGATYCTATFDSAGTPYTAAQCGEAAAGCCEVDTTKCASYACSSSDFYNANPGTTLPTTTTTAKDTACCVKRATCRDYFASVAAVASGTVQGMPAVAALAAAIAVTASWM